MTMSIRFTFSIVTTGTSIIANRQYY